MKRNYQRNNNVVTKLEKELLSLKSEMEQAYFEERRTKDSIIHDLKNRVDVLNRQLTDVKKENEELRSNQQDQQDDDKDQEISNLIHDNTILNEECLRLRDQCDYLMMRENKLKYFYDTLNTNIHPTNGGQEQEAKDIPTTRFYEFLEAQNQAPYPHYNDHGHMYSQPKHYKHHSYDTYHLSAPHDPDLHSKIQSEPGEDNHPIPK